MKLTKKILIKPTINQKNQIDFWLRRCSNLYNIALEEKISYYKVKNKYLDYYQQKKELVDIKNFDSSWKDIPNKSLTEVLLRLHKSYLSFFKDTINNGFPKYIKSENFNTIYFVKNDVRLKNNKLYLPKIKTDIKYNELIPDNYDGIYLIRERKKYFLSFIYNIDEIKPINYNKIIGVDLGLKSLLTTNEGEIYNRLSLKLYNKYQKRIKNLNKSLSRKNKKSIEYNKAKKQLNKTYNRLSNTRNDYLHKTSTNFINKNINNLLVIGDIMVDKIIKHSYTSKKIQNKKGFRRNFYNAALSEFKKMLKYKSLKYGCEVIFVNEMNTSKTCSCCGHKKDDLKLSDRVFKCDKCKIDIDRDMNAAINIKAVWLGQFKSKDLDLCNTKNVA